MENKFESHDSKFIRKATIDDISKISEIYNYYVEHSTATFAYKIETFDERLKWFLDHQNSNKPVIICEVANEICGWGSLSTFNSRDGYCKTVEFSIYLAHNQIGFGYGGLLLKNLIQLAKHDNYHVLIGGACHENTGSVNLMIKNGFEKVGHLKQAGLKFERWLDVLYYQLIL